MTNIHYPISIHLQDAYRDLNKKGDYSNAELIAETELSLQLYYGMSYEYVSRVIELCNAFKC